MRRALAAVAAAVAVGAVAAPMASAHPLGNFSINHLSTVRVSDTRVDVRYVLDQAEIPTLQERSLSRPELLVKKRAEVLGGLELRVDGHPRVLRETGRAELSFPPGAGGLRTSRFTFRLAATMKDPTRVVLEDGTFPDRVGWKAIVSAPGRGTTVRTNAPSGDPTHGLRRYPQDLLNSPLNRRQASFSVKPGTGALEAPRSEGGHFATTHTSGDGFASVFERAASGEGVLVLLLLTAFAWGALHALSPGHGKAMVAAYLVGTKGRPRHAVALGMTVTVAHTIGVFALGFVTLALSQYVLPEDLYPWLNVVSGLLVVAIGAGVLRSRIRWARARRHAHEHHEHEHSHEPAHEHDHGHDHAREHAHDHAREHAHDHTHHHDHGHTHANSLRSAGFGHFMDHVRGRPHGHGHHHTHPTEDHMVTRRSLIGLGAAAGMIPCPSALVVLLAAVSQHEIGLGLVLILAFSLGLAGTLTGLGLAVVYARRLAPRLSLPRAGAVARLATALPAASAVAIVGVGCVLTANALPSLM